MDNFARRPDLKRKTYFEETAERCGVDNIIVEKDFWVCWTLKRLFTNPELAPFFTFKGGTSLSKAYGLIDRFSEDIDLTISRSTPALADVKDVSEQEISGKERKRRLTALKEAAQKYIKDSVFSILQDTIQKELGASDQWQLALDQEDPDLQTILFYYPKVFDYGGFGQGQYGEGLYGNNYIRPHIKLEFGARGDIEPHETRTITSYAAETLPTLFDSPSQDIPVLAAERTFWEKATILHALHHKSKLRDRMSRHYYDTFMLYQKGVAENALQKPGLLENVVRNKILLFRDPNASYDTAIIGSLKLVPTIRQKEVLKADYGKMGEMFMGDYPDFETVLAGLEQLEKTINKAG